MSRQKDLAAIDPYEANRGLCQAQQAGKIPRIGWIVLGSPAGSAADVFSYYDSFRAGLSELGYVRTTTLSWSPDPRKACRSGCHVLLMSCCAKTFP